MLLLSVIEEVVFEIIILIHPSSTYRGSFALSTTRKSNRCSHLSRHCRTIITIYSLYLYERSRYHHHHHQAVWYRNESTIQYFYRQAINITQRRALVTLLQVNITVASERGEVLLTRRWIEVDTNCIRCSRVVISKGDDEQKHNMLLSCCCDDESESRRRRKAQLCSQEYYLVTTVTTQKYRQPVSSLLQTVVVLFRYHSTPRPYY